METTRQISSVTRESLIKAFTICGKPYQLCYRKIGQMGKRWLREKDLLDQMISEGVVTVVDNNARTITYKYVGL